MASFTGLEFLPTFSSRHLISIKVPGAQRVPEGRGLRAPLPGLRFNLDPPGIRTYFQFTSICLPSTVTTSDRFAEASSQRTWDRIAGSSSIMHDPVLQISSPEESNTTYQIRS